MKSILIFLTLISFTLCNDVYYENLFNDLLTDESNRGDTPLSYYFCIRRYVRLKGLVSYSIQDNPDDKNFSKVNCDKIITDLKKGAAEAMASSDDLGKNEKICVRHEFLEGNFYDAMAIVVAIARLNDAQIFKVEKEKFIVKMREMTKTCNKCVENKHNFKAHSKPRGHSHVLKQG